MKHRLLVVFALACAAPTLAAPQPALCRVQVFTDYSMLGIGYYAVPQLAPECALSAVGRLRKSSTLNVKARGAAFQPIRPLKGAWSVSVGGNDVPNAEKYVYWYSTWEWQWFDGHRWIPADVL